MPKAAPKKKAANGYKLPEPFTEGEVLEDVAKKKWILGPSIGQGGFGEIYAAKEFGSKDSKYPYAIKIENHENGPLFVEMHFYIKNGKPEDVEEFKNQKGLKTFGMPVYHGSGSHELNGEKYRFLVMEKFGTDLWKTFLEHDRHFPSATVFKLAVQLLDVLEYIHSKGYVHSDIKGSNILMGVTKATQNKQVYLADFGISCKPNEEEEFKPNPKKAHDGTIEYLSRDAHSGVQTKRGDLETLAYNLIQWLGCTLPWENDLKDPESVQKSKEEYMASVPKFIKACFDKRSPSGPIVDFLNCLVSLEHNSTPDYKTIRKIFLSGITGGDALGKPFQFAVPESKSPKTSPAKRKNENSAASSKKKVPKLDLEEDASEEEKENLDDLSDQEEVPKKAKGRPKARPKGKNVNTAPKEKKKAVGRKRAKKTEDEEDEDLELENNVENDDAHDSDIGDDEEITKKEEKIAAPKENKKPRGRKRAKKEVNGKGHDRLIDEDNDDQPNPVPEVSTRSTRQRGSRTVNYREDSDDEEFYRIPKPRMAPVATVKEVTGEESEISSSQKKKEKKKSKTKKPVEKEEEIEEEVEDEDEKEEEDRITDEESETSSSKKKKEKKKAKTKKPVEEIEEEVEEEDEKEEEVHITDEESETSSSQKKKEKKKAKTKKPVEEKEEKIEEEVEEEDEKEEEVHITGEESETSTSQKKKEKKKTKTKKPVKEKEENIEEEVEEEDEKKEEDKEKDEKDEDEKEQEEKEEEEMSDEDLEDIDNEDIRG